MSTPWPLPKPCQHCGGTEGHIIEKGGQNTLWCSGCGKYQQYNVPKRLTGQAVRSVSTRPGIKPSKRWRILERDGNACVACHQAGVPLHVGHLISVEDGKQHGIPDEVIYDDLNLVALCEECNLGLGRSTVAVRLMAHCLAIHIAGREAGAA